jgi:hypothetical protein
MIIKTDDYILKQISEDSLFWDLTFSKIVNKGKANERVEFKDPIYGISIESAKKRIALWRTNKKLPEETTPQEFNKVYSGEKKIIEKELVDL